MKKGSISVIALTFVFLSACFLFTGACAVVDKGNTAKLASNDRPAHEVPEGKKQKWESIQNIVKREHSVCIEHCGNDPSCLDRCEKAYKSRLDREYKKLMYE